MARIIGQERISYTISHIEFHNTVSKYRSVASYLKKVNGFGPDLGYWKRWIRGLSP
jgi:hypothetical protein